MLRRFALIFVAGCADGTDYFELQPAEAAAQLADRGCDRAFGCGVVEFDCEAVPPTVTVRTGAEYYGSLELCQMNLEQYYTALLIGCTHAALTDGMRDDYNQCNNGPTTCYTDAEIAELMNAVCNQLPHGTEECQGAAVTIEACQLCVDNPADPACAN